MRDHLYRPVILTLSHWHCFCSNVRKQLISPPHVKIWFNEMELTAEIISRGGILTSNVQARSYHRVGLSMLEA